MGWIRRSLRTLLGRRPGKPLKTGDGHALARPSLSAEPPFIYAIGDVHGCLDELQRLEAQITADAQGHEGLKLIVMLGDYVDRGPDSAGVIDHLIAAPPAGFHRLCLRGNHDDVLLKVLEGSVSPEWWLDFGGEQTLLSYGYDIRHLLNRKRRGLRTLIREFAAEFPEDHRLFLQGLPASLTTPRFFFSHAGARPGRPLSEQSDEDLLWIRNDFIGHDGEPFSRVVVHGHTPTPKPVVSVYRIGVDTGAYRTGTLTAARLTAKGGALLST